MERITKKEEKKRIEADKRMQVIREKYKVEIEQEQEKGKTLEDYCIEDIEMLEWENKAMFDELIKKGYTATEISNIIINN